MSAYFILSQTITDQQTYCESYLPQALAIFTRHGAEVVVAELEAKPLQGIPPQGVVVLRFPSEQAIRDCLDDPEYQPLNQLRLDLTQTGHAVIAPAFATPGG